MDENYDNIDVYFLVCQWPWGHGLFFRSKYWYEVYSSQPLIILIKENPTNTCLHIFVEEPHTNTNR